MRRFWHERAKWSAKTFGTPQERGPAGPLKHLEKEVKEVQDSPNDPEEYADCLFLIFDAAWRSGFEYDELVAACMDKLEKNRKRTWGPPNADGIREHVKGEGFGE